MSYCGVESDASNPGHPWLRCLRPTEDASLEARLFQMISLAWGSAVLFVVTPVNFLWAGAAARVESSGALVAFGVFALWTWREARCGRLWVRTFFVMHLVALDAMWFLGAGSTGATVLFNFSLLILPLVFLRGAPQAVLCVFIGGNAVALFALEYFHPEWVIRHASSFDRMMDVTTTTLVVLAGIGAALSVVVRGYRREREQLAHALAEVRTLRGLLPICAWCRRICDEHGQWQHLERYLQDHTDVQTTHGMCPECGDKFMADADARDDRRPTRLRG